MISARLLGSVLALSSLSWLIFIYNLTTVLEIPAGVGELLPAEEFINKTYPDYIVYIAYLSPVLIIYFSALLIISNDYLYIFRVFSYKYYKKLNASLIEKYER